MYKIMALDVGTKRIGVALSDFLHVIATPHSCIQRQPEENALEEIQKIAKENHVEKIVGFDIILEDERLTSEEAESRLKSRKIDFRKNKGLVDIESACVILEQYLGR